MGFATTIYEATKPEMGCLNPSTGALPDGSTPRWHVLCANHAAIVAGPFTTAAAAVTAAQNHMSTASVGSTACNLYGTSDSSGSTGSHA